MKKFYVDFSATMTVSANSREEANHIFYNRIYGIVSDADIGIDYAKVNCIEEVEKEEK